MGCVTGAAQLQFFGYPTERHRRFFTESPRNPHLLRVPFASHLQLCGRPSVPSQFTFQQPLGLSLGRILSFCPAVMRSHFGFHPRQQFLARFLIAQAPTPVRCMDSPGSLGTGLPEGLQEPVAVQAVLKDGFAAVATIQDMVNGARVLDANLTSHTYTATVSNPVRFVNQKIC